MLQIPLWSRILTGLILLAGLLIALPNAGPAVRNHLPGWLQNSVSLGLDLQGGSRLVLQVEFAKVQQEKLQNLLADIRTAFRKPRIAYSNPKIQGDTISLQVTDPSRADEARKLLGDLNPLTNATLLGTGGLRAYEVSEPGNGVFVMKMSDTYKKQTSSQILTQSQEVVRRRVDETGTTEASVSPQGADRLVVEVPGLKDPAHLKAQLGKTAKMTFQLVDENADPSQVEKGIIPFEDVVLPYPGDPRGKLAIQRRVMVDGSRLTDAAAGFDQQTGQPNVSLKFDSVGTKEFGDTTKANVNHSFAIVLDGKIIEAANIREPILTGNAQISGGFTTQSANDLASLLRAGALPAPLSIIEERTVGAELGADSISAGSKSAIAGLTLVVLFMIARYGLFGVFADVALTFNIILLLAALTLFGATLTLPGIAGIVLTMGMAVDANVLIYERIREEVRNGRSMLAAIDSGFKRAMATIIDANMTHLIAACILYMVGTGPVRGFAVALGVGIITSFFTAVMVTRLIVVIWLNVRRPKRLYI